MLKEFNVCNFKNFKDNICFKLDKPSNYEFNTEAVSDGCITKGIIFGPNGSGKSNLALAIFDIIIHMTDKEKALDKYEFYQNLDSDKTLTLFRYIFSFGKNEVIYEYTKADAETLIYESLHIGGEHVLSYDFKEQSGHISLKGAENLKMSSSLMDGNDKLSRVKYVRNNAILADNEINRAFMDFTSFVDRMLMFYSLRGNRYQGLCLGADSFTEGIIREGKLSDFQAFLKSQGIEYNLESVDVNGKPEIFCRYKGNSVPFVKVASTGTMSLALFYYWYIKMSEASLVFIDEYDAFYHFELSQEIVKMVKPLKNTQIFFTSHNTDLLSNDILRPDAYFIINNNEIKSLDKRTDKELRKAHNVQKMFKAGTFNE